ncbi:MAG: hypothetical protein ACREGR_01675, partial [Minisyncoccia bacterium]
TINNGISIVGFCGYSGGVKYCTSDASADQIDIVFTRPNTTALITALKNLSIVGNNLQSACIALASPAGNRRYISVSLVGEIDLPSSCTGL